MFQPVLDQPRVVEYISQELDALMARHALPPKPTVENRDCRSPSPMGGGLVGARNPLSILRSAQYVQRLASFLQCPLECLLAGLVLVQRLEAKAAAATAASTSASQHGTPSCKPVMDEDSDDDERDEFSITSSSSNSNHQEQQQHQEFHHLASDKAQQDLLSFGQDKAQVLSSFLACTVLAIKQFCDSFDTMIMYAQVGGMHPRILCQRESRVLRLLAWDISIDLEVDLAPLLADCGCPIVAAAPSSPLDHSSSAAMDQHRVPVNSTAATAAANHKSLGNSPASMTAGSSAGGLSDEEEDDDSYPSPCPPPRATTITATRTAMTGQ